jgi:signal transduction histidine kinase
MMSNRPDQDGKPSILIVDDNAENLRLLSQMLAREGYRFRVAGNGRRALESVQANPPDLILLDIMMPEMDGYAVCETLKADPETEDIPVLFVSALDGTWDKVKAFSVGGVDYVSKPFEVAEVLARIETHLTLHNLQKRLEQQVAELDAFAHTVAHDLKNPLNVLLGYADLLVQASSDVEDDVISRASHAISDTALKMNNIVEELLLLASVRQMDQVPVEALNMAPIVDEAQKRLAPLIEEHQAQVTRRPVWPAAWGYAPWVEEVWVNLISNAAKYSGQPEKGIRPQVELGADRVPPEDEPSPSNRPPMVRFWVQDNGPGLTPAEQEQLFTEFTRFHQVATEGHGLGLSIVRRIVDKLGGHVGVESAPGEGSLFYFTLPAASDE